MNRRLFKTWAFAAGAVFPVVLVAYGAVLTVFYHVTACPLCIVQRMLYLMIAAAFLAGLVAKHQLMQALFSMLACLAAIIGATIAGYQIYLQKHPFTASCGDGTSWWEQIIDSAGRLAPPLFKAEGFCTDNNFPIFGLSFVELSLCAFIALILLALLAARLSAAQSR